MLEIVGKVCALLLWVQVCSCLLSLQAHTEVVTLLLGTDVPLGLAKDAGFVLILEVTTAVGIKRRLG